MTLMALVTLVKLLPSLKKIPPDPMFSVLATTLPRKVFPPTMRLLPTVRLLLIPTLPPASQVGPPLLRLTGYTEPGCGVITPVV